MWHVCRLPVARARPSGGPDWRWPGPAIAARGHSAGSSRRALAQGTAPVHRIIDAATPRSGQFVEMPSWLRQRHGYKVLSCMRVGGQADQGLTTRKGRTTAPAATTPCRAACRCRAAVPVRRRAVILADFAVPGLPRCRTKPARSVAMTGAGSRACPGGGRSAPAHLRPRLHRQRQKPSAADRPQAQLRREAKAHELAGAHRHPVFQPDAKQRIVCRMAFHQNDLLAVDHLWQ